MNTLAVLVFIYAKRMRYKSETNEKYENSNTKEQGKKRMVEEHKNKDGMKEMEEITQKTCKEK